MEYQPFLDRSQDAIFIKNSSGQYLYVNETGARMLGRNVSEVIGKTDLDLYDRASAKRMIARDRRIMQSGESWTYEDAGTARSNHISYQATKAPLHGPDGEVIGLIGVARALKQVDQVKNERAVQVELPIADAFFVMDRDGSFTYLNRQAEELLGASREELLGTLVASQFPVPPESLQLPSGHSARFECFHSRTGAWFELHLYPFEGNVGVYATDITRRKRREQDWQELLELEKKARCEAETAARRIQEITSVLPQFVWERAEDAPEYTNGQWAAYTGCRPEELTGEQWLSTIHPDDRDRSRESWEQAKKNGTPYYCEYRIRARDGTYRWFLSRAMPIRDEDGKVVRWAGVTNDIQVFRDIDEQRANFISVASHELRTPLTAIKTALQIQEGVLIHSRPIPIDVQRRVLEIALDSTERMAKLINELLEFSRIHSGALTLYRASIDLGALVRESVMAHTGCGQAEIAHSIQVTTPDRLEGRFDALRMRQVVDNLLDNAIKYSPQGGKIEVTLSDEGACACLTIRDQGIGIHPKDLEKIFHPFERAAPTKNFGGFGIGLYISRRIVQAHGGEITARSAGERGSVFTVRLPLDCGELSDETSIAG